MKKRIFRMMCLLMLIIMTATTALVLGVLYAKEYVFVQARVRNEAILIAQGMDMGGEAYLQQAVAGLTNNDRVTIIAADGTVLFDSRADSESMENHGQRPEVAAVLGGAPSAAAVRQSQTLGKHTFYYAVPLGEHQVLRLSVETQDIVGQFSDLLPWLICMAGVVLLISIITAQRMAETIISPLVNLDLAHPLEVDAYEEISPILMRIAHQNRSIDEHMKELSAKQEEFRALSENMSEGLLLLDNDAAIMSINQSALQLLGGNAKQPYTGRHVLQLTRLYELQKVIEQALQGDKASRVLPFAGRQYHVFANPVFVEEEQRGALLLFLDVTEQQQAEQMRREFSANVSHELKTPLTSISGYAEMLASGMVRAEDTQEFAGRIYKEAQRLLVLIDDIIKLSGLDENRIHTQAEEVDLYTLALQTANSLMLQAQERHVQIAVEGAPVKIQAVPTMASELLFNLAENAVKYNCEDGKVTISVQKTASGAELSIKDTGIGIAPKDQEHVFERFYRVDKSRSKETGGTGLGLSIVKHIAQLHHARIQLESTEGQGTEVRIIFPLRQDAE